MNCNHDDQWFDRTICPEPCGMMHTYCNECGANLGYCPWDDPDSTHDVVVFDY